MLYLLNNTKERLITLRSPRHQVLDKQQRIKQEQGEHFKNLLPHYIAF
jgi:hypothetical protein